MLADTNLYWKDISECLFPLSKPGAFGLNEMLHSGGERIFVQTAPCKYQVHHKNNS